MVTMQTGHPVEAWNAIAEGYDRFVTHTESWLANEALTRAGLRRGDRFLDVAAGCGGLSLPAARLGARVVATDWAPAMIRLLDVRARQEGLDTVSAQVMDCHALQFEDGSFDVTGSQFGVMLVPDQPAALREMARVTRTGGRVLLIAYGPPPEVEFLQFFIGALHAVDPAFTGIPDDAVPLEFQAADPAALGQRLMDAGLRGVDVVTVRERLAFTSGREFWDWVMYGNPIPGMLTAHLSEQQKADACRVLDGMLQERGDGRQPAMVTNAVHIGIGIK